MKILFILTYYRPHVSGLTIYVERLARALAERGHDVTVLTSQYLKELPREEMLNGVRVVRVPVLFRLNKGVLMPAFPIALWREIGKAEVVSIHLPQIEAAVSALVTRLRGRKPLLTYHCDLEMPPLWYGKIVDRVTYWDNLLAGWLADTFVAYTQDFANHSPVLSRFKKKVRVILPPVVIPPPTDEGVREMRERATLGPATKVIGFAARFAYEKGAGYLINAIPQIVREFGDVKVLFAGPYGKKDVIGETIFDDLQPLIREYQEHLVFLGTLNPAEMGNFFAACDVVTVPSINNTESFGLVQVEAFMCGTPVVATNLPGVRQPVTMTGMGEIVPIADEKGLAEGIIKVLRNREKYVKPRDEIMRMFEMSRTVEAYEALFREKKLTLPAQR